MTTDTDRALDAVYAAIQEALDLIDQHLDGPCTMRDALKVVKERVEDVRTESVIREASIEELSAALGVLRNRRNLAFRDRDRAVRAFRIANQALAAWEYVMQRAQRSKNSDLIGQIRYYLSNFYEG